jgi:hypothetical protein
MREIVKLIWNSMQMIKAPGKQLNGKSVVKNPPGVTLMIIFPIVQSRAEVYEEKNYFLAYLHK